VYVVLEFGDTNHEPFALTAPIPGEIETLVALVVVQDRVVDWPAEIVEGWAEMVAVGGPGGGGGGGVEGPTSELRYSSKSVNPSPSESPLPSRLNVPKVADSHPSAIPS